MTAVRVCVSMCVSAGFHTRAQVLVGASLGENNKLEKMNGVYAAYTQVFTAYTQVFAAYTQVFAACIQHVCTQKWGLNKHHKIVQTKHMYEVTKRDTANVCKKNSKRTK